MILINISAHKPSSGILFILLWLNGLRIWHYYKLQHRMQMWLGSGIAVAVAQAGSCISNSVPRLGTSICCRCGPKKEKKKKEFDLKLDLTSIQINLAIFEKLENMVCSVLNHGLLCQGITQQQQDHMNTYKWVMHKVVSELIK